MPDQLSLRALCRITLGRQLLLDCSALTPAQASTHLAGLRAQAPPAPYVGLQARLASFRPEQLENLLNERAILRAHLMRNTVHLVTTPDYLRFRPLFQPSMGRALSGHWGRAGPITTPPPWPTPPPTCSRWSRSRPAACGASPARLREVTERLGVRLRPRPGPDGALLLDLADAPADPAPIPGVAPGMCASPGMGNSWSRA